VTEAGAVQKLLLLARSTVAPAGPAGPLILIVPVHGAPATTDEGVSVRDVIPGVLIVRPADCVDAANFAVIVAAVWVFTPVVFTVNVAIVWPPGTFTEVGGMAEGVLLRRVIVKPL
jgi:hypothetical protein